MKHERVIRQYNLFGLIIAVCDYGIDYYWRDHWLFTSGRWYIAFREYSLSLYQGKLRFRKKL